MNLREIIRREKRFVNTPFFESFLQKRQLAKRDGEYCKYCKVRMYVSNLTIDHVIPTRDNGADTLENKQLLCFECHREKTRKENIARSQKQKIALNKVLSNWKQIPEY